MIPPASGDQVMHPLYGAGEVVRTISGGRYLLVRFEGRRVLSQVRPEELRRALEVERVGRPPAGAPAPEPVAMESLLAEGIEGDHQALQVLEALRVGVAPAHLVELYTVGRERELAVIREDLAEAGRTGAARVLLGEYGAGKTHMLECLEEEARRRNFLVSRVTLDGEEVSPCQPRRVYRAVVRQLVYPDRPGSRGLEPLLEAACESGIEPWLSRRGSGFHAYLSPALAYYRELRAAEGQGGALRTTLLDWLEGHPTVSNTELEPALRAATGLRGHRLYALQDHRTLAHLYAYLLGGVAALARQVGYAGVAVLFDEAEFYSLLSNQAREFADLLFGYYSAAALGPSRVSFDLADPLVARRGGHAVHRSFPPLFKDPQHLYCVFAMTEDPAGVRTLSRILDEGRFTRLAPLTLAHYQELCRRILELYRRTYPEFSAAAQVERPMGEVVFQGVEGGRFENPRQVLKFVLELLDFTRLCRDQVPEYVRELRSYLN